jgi:broad specificity phosphatase PhoE
MARRFWQAGALALFLLSAGTAAANEADDMWAALAQGGKVILLRHSLAPGIEQGREGDPPGFRLDDCATQRNLSAAGRQQAIALGNALRAHRVQVTRVLSSPWCRCLDTARLMNLGPTAEPSDWLHNFGEENVVGGGASAATRTMPGREESRQAFYRLVESWSGPGNLVLVSHGRTVANLLWGPGHQSPDQGTLYVLQPQPARKGRPFERLGSIRAPD